MAGSEEAAGAAFFDFLVFLAPAPAAGWQSGLCCGLCSEHTHVRRTAHETGRKEVKRNRQSGGQTNAWFDTSHHSST